MLSFWKLELAQCSCGSRVTVPCTGLPPAPSFTAFPELEQTTTGDFNQGLQQRVTQPQSLSPCCRNTRLSHPLSWQGWGHTLKPPPHCSWVTQPVHGTETVQHSNAVTHLSLQTLPLQHKQLTAMWRKRQKLPSHPRQTCRIDVLWSPRLVPPLTSYQGDPFHPFWATHKTQGTFSSCVTGIYKQTSLKLSRTVIGKALVPQRSVITC